MPEGDERKDDNFLGAIARAHRWLGLAVNVAAMLISFLALIALTNGILGGIPQLARHGWVPSSLQQIFGWLFSPIAWVIGVPWHDARAIGNLLGIRMVLNELVAFSFLGPMKATLDPRSFTIATFALCGFANFSSIGIQIGGIGALPRISAASWPNWASAPCSLAPWRTCSPPRSWECSCESFRRPCNQTIARLHTRPSVPRN